MADTPICVMLDANVWFAERLLRSTMGAALIHIVLRKKWRVGLPETVEKETSARLEEQGVKASNEVLESARLLEHLTGARTTTPPPSQESIRHGIRARWHELDPVLERMPLTIEIARAALDRVVCRMAPSERGEQFRDCCLWEHVLDVARGSEVHFVTQDGDFCEKGKTDLGFAKILREQGSSDGRKIIWHRTIADCVEHLEKAAPVANEAELATRVSAALKPELDQSAANRQFNLGALASFSVKSFPTDKPSAVALTFELTFALADQQASRTAATLTVYGNCTFNPITQEISEVRRDRETFTWVDAQGAQQQNTNHFVYLAGTITMQMRAGGSLSGA